MLIDDDLDGFVADVTIGISSYSHGSNRERPLAWTGFWSENPNTTANPYTIAQSQCKHATDYADVETLICDLPIDHLTFAAHDSLAPYSGPYPMALLVRACLLKEINSWDETALHDHLRAHPSLREALGFESLPNPSVLG